MSFFVDVDSSGLSRCRLRATRNTQLHGAAPFAEATPVRNMSSP